MLTCKDCLHYCVCKDTVADENWGENTPELVKEMFSPKGCENYKLAADVVEVRHGAIIETIKNGKMNRVFSCCNTDCTQLTSWVTPNYCPNCGAEMSGKDNENV